MGHPATAEETRTGGVLEDASVPAHHVDGVRTARRILLRAQMSKASPRPARGMSDDRERSRVRPRVALGAVPVADD